MTEEEEEATTAPPLKNQSPPSPVEFASSLKVLGWFVQLLFDNCLTAIQDRGVITDKPDPFEALESLLDELNSVQAMLSLAQNFGGQHGGLLELLKDLMDAAYETDDLLSEVDYYRLEQQVEQQVDDSEDEDLLRKVEYRLQKTSISSTVPSFHDDNKVTIVRRIHEIVSRLDHLVTRLSEALSLLEPEEVVRANPNVFPVASHPLTTSFLLSNHDNLLEDFPESEFLSGFNKCAFGVEDPSDHLGLGEIAKQIAGKLNGSSLAAKIVGGLLRDNLDEQHWRSVLCSDIWQQRRGPHDIMPILRFSYHHLPAHLQQCFAYCGIFPKNYELEKEKLVGMWISQGYIHTESGGSRSPEEIGSEYLDNLVSKSFIQASSHGRMALFVLHELLHDLAEYVLKDECLRIDSNGTEKITNRVRHIYVRESSLGLLKSCNLRNLRTLILYRSYAVDIIDDNALTEVLNGLKNIRVLSLGMAYLTDFRGSLGHLIHLRYLTVRANIQDMWPDNCRLYHLQWLIIGTLSCSSKVLPAALNWLVSLRHFQHRCIIYGIGNLTHLQWLSPFSVGKNRTEKLGQLKRLNELRGTLKLLSLQHASTKEEALEANLNRKIGIRELELNCYRSHASPQMAEQVFEGLQPPPYIKKLTLDGYNGVKSPSWFLSENNCVSYLQSLCLQNCSSWKVLPPLGELPLLKHLKIDKAPSVEEIGNSFYGSGVAKAFPCLDTLELNNMRRLVLWPGIEMKDRSPSAEYPCPAFPRLRELNLTDCRKLEEVPILYMATVELLRTNSLVLLAKIEYLISLRDLFIERCHQVVSVDLKRLPSLEILYMSDCNSIKSVPLLPPTLKRLEFSRLKKLKAFSREQERNLSDLTSLQYLYICDCPSLRTLPLMPASLQKLSIKYCPKLSRERYQVGGGDWHKISHVPTINWQVIEDI